jgi:hypothetical protein
MSLSTAVMNPNCFPKKSISGNYKLYQTWSDGLYIQKFDPIGGLFPVVRIKEKLSLLVQKEIIKDFPSGTFQTECFSKEIIDQYPELFV